MTSRLPKIFAVTGLSLAMGLSLASEADARRGGSFGSRGARTHQAPPPTQTAPTQAAPVQRSMTERQPGAQTTAPARPNAANPMNAPKPGLLGNPLVRGLMLGGVIGLLLGHGFGAGMAGMLGGLLQIAAIALVAMLAFRFFASRRKPAAAHAQPTNNNAAFRSPFDVQQPAQPAAPQNYAPADLGQDFTVTNTDRETFEQLLREIQEAFGREDYAAIRERTTPEIMGYLAEELGQNATAGRRNEVRDVKMLEGDVAEAWREGPVDYATAALRYTSIDVMVDRQTGAVVEGDADRPTETTELWTFVRHPNEGWKLSAIQDA
ncbi:MULTISPECIES: TIM44-like domain-containing protein [unclassified Phenylobacterium]|uniref:TIM44-like domain-containing protein n=1 Tax=unclassified Phenylobacterium TaxID=2640670 RepID=UPI000A7E7C59|nr:MULTISPECIES: TIM44-like domain-containing protein [unclassified Phenylobacterium]